METRSLLRQIMGYSVSFGFLILLAVAANGDEPATTHPPYKSSALSSPHPTVAASESSQNATTSETIDKSRENGKKKTSGEVDSKESNEGEKQPPKATISTNESSPGEKQRAKPGQAKGEGEMRAPPKSAEQNSTQTHVNSGCGDTCRPSSAATCGSRGLIASLGIIMAVVPLSPALLPSLV